MNRKYHYFYVVVVEEHEGKSFASVIRVSDCDNIAYRFDKYICAIIMPTKKKSEEVADFWNECYKKNGTLYTGIDFV